MKFEIYKDADGKYHWRLLSAQDELMAESVACERKSTAVGSLGALIQMMFKDKYEINDVTGEPPNNLDIEGWKRKQN